MKKGSGRKISPLKELSIFTKQNIRILFSDKKNLAVSLLFPVVAAIIVVWIAGENMFVNCEGTKSGSFVVVSAAIWGGLFNSIQTVVKERANVKRDYVAGIRIRSYTMSRAMVQFALCIIQSAILSLSYIGVQMRYDNSMPDEGVLLRSTMLEYFISIFLLMYAADAMGLMISCIVKKSETANVMAPYILIVQLIFSGVLFDMKGVADKFSYLMISRWGMEALGSTCNLNDMPLRIQEEFPMVPHEADDMFTYSTAHLELVWCIFIFFILFFLFTGNLLLHRVSKDSK